MRLMGEEERDELISVLETNIYEISNQLGHMPIANITLLHRKKITELENELDELNLKISSLKTSKKIYVAL
jgi:archaellum component FlaC